MCEYQWSKMYLIFFVFCLLAFISVRYVKVVFIVASVSIAASYAVEENTKNVIYEAHTKFTSGSLDFMLAPLRPLPTRHVFVVPSENASLSPCLAPIQCNKASVSALEEAVNTNVPFPGNTFLLFLFINCTGIIDPDLCLYIKILVGKNMGPPICKVKCEFTMRTFCLCLTALKVNRLVKSHRESPEFRFGPFELQNMNTPNKNSAPSHFSEPMQFT